MQTKVSNFFKSKFNCSGEQYCAPGRVNIIGEHTDYNQGFVLPGAIAQTVIAEIKPNDTNIVRVHSIDFDDYAEFNLNLDEMPEKIWVLYIYGVCKEMLKIGAKVGGFDAAFSGSVPFGAGLSSSAALESVFAFAINHIFNQDSIDKMKLVFVGQATEHNYCGVKCGVMDQFASLFGKKDYLMRLDCRSMEYVYEPFNAKGYKLVLVNSKVKHELVDSPYNKRRESCERVAEALSMPSLRDVTMEQLEMVKSVVSEEDYKRATFIVGEKQRVLDVCDALENGDMERAGRDIYATHWGLSRDYEVSCEELDFLVETASECGVTGSRIMGGGFGGCTINLVNDEMYDDFITITKSKFKTKYGIEPDIIDVEISEGARKL